MKVKFNVFVIFHYMNFICIYMLISYSGHPAVLLSKEDSEFIESRRRVEKVENKIRIRIHLSYCNFQNSLKDMKSDLD